MVLRYLKIAYYNTIRVVKKMILGGVK